MNSYSNKIKDVIPVGLRIINPELMTLKPTAITGTVAHNYETRVNLECPGLTYHYMIHHANRSILYQRHSLGRQYSLVLSEVSCPSYRSSEGFVNMKLLRGCFDSYGRHSAFQPETKNPDLCSSILVISSLALGRLDRAHVAYAASHAVLECLNKNQDLSAKRILKCNRLEAQTTIFYHNLWILQSLINP